MRIAVPKEIDPHESRVALTPETTTKLTKLGAEVCIESGLGAKLGWDDSSYTDAGATVLPRAELLASADLVMRVRQAPADEISSLQSGSMHLSFLDGFNNRDLVESLASHQIRTLSMEMVPRSTLAQKVDALSSQHSIAGYYMVLLAAERLGKALPMMMTPAGTIQPARVFVIGAGVAGLQAIATAKRLGARVEAFDTRPVVKEQVESLGAKFVDIDLGDTGQTAQGYAKELTDEQKAKQQAGMEKAAAQADIVITTAQLFGRQAPVVVHKSMLEKMRPGSIVVDYAVESGGNVEGSVAGEEVEVEGVRVIGLRNYPGHVAQDASRMFANNCYNMVAHFWDKDRQSMILDRQDDIAKGAQITGGGHILSSMLRTFYKLDALADDCADGNALPEAENKAEAEAEDKTDEAADSAPESPKQTSDSDSDTKTDEAAEADTADDSSDKTDATSEQDKGAQA